MVLLKLKRQNVIEYKLLSEEEVETLKHTFIVYKHYGSKIEKNCWLPLPEFEGRHAINFEDTQINFIRAPLAVLNGMDRIGSFENQILYDSVLAVLKTRTSMIHIRAIYEDIRENETEREKLYYQSVKNSCDHLIIC